MKPVLIVTKLTGDEVAPPSDQKFGITFGCLFLLIALVPPLLGGHFRWWLLVIGVALIVIAMAVPAWLRTPNRLWFRFGLLLHKIVNPLVLGGLFLIAVTPLALIMRLAGKNLLNRSYEPAVKSYWIERNPPGPSPDSIRNQF